MANRAEHPRLTCGRGLLEPALAWVLLFALTMMAPSSAKAQTYNVMHSFTGLQDGLYPVSGVTIDGGGNLYGTTNIGGSGANCYEGCGATFELAHRGSGWLFTPLYDFVGGNDGGNSDARLIIGPDGSLYGTTSQGGGTGCGGAGCGTVFNLRPPAHFSGNVFGGWTETVLYRFNGGSDGNSPRGADLVFDRAGNLYGTTLFGGGGSCQDGCGTVFKLARSDGSWTESIIHTFSQSGDGQEPWAGVIFDQAGSLYGTTTVGGAYGQGTVYQLIPSGSGFTERVLYSFHGATDGGLPYGGLILDSAGNLYGTTCCGGSGGGGTVFQLTRSQNWAFSVLASFTGDGSNGSLVMDTAGNLYGTTYEGGGFGFGSVFKLTPSEGGWTYTALHNFCANGWPCSDGAFPPSGLALDAEGNFYGTTSDGGAHGGGVVFEITP
jgi:uncharacterized repeat protein (TIGR03803 family)